MANYGSWSSLNVSNLGGEKTNYSPGIIEFALAHQLDEKIEGAYLRSELVEPRRPLMQDWANYLTANASETNIEISLLN